MRETEILSKFTLACMCRGAAWHFLVHAVPVAGQTCHQLEACLNLLMHDLQEMFEFPEPAGQVEGGAKSFLSGIRRPCLGSPSKDKVNMHLVGHGP